MYSVSIPVLVLVSDLLASMFQVNNVAITGISMHEVYALMQGPEGSDLCLHLRQPRNLRSPAVCARGVCVRACVRQRADCIYGF
jgi:hypothetical protein